MAKTFTQAKTIHMDLFIFWDLLSCNVFIGQHIYATSILISFNKYSKYIQHTNL